MQHIKLSELQKGEFGEILAIAAQGLELELMRLGLVTGDRVCMTNAAPMGGPVAVEISGNKVAMRKSDAAKITIRRVGGVKG